MHMKFFAVRVKIAILVFFLQPFDGFCESMETQTNSPQIPYALSTSAGFLGAGILFSLKLNEQRELFTLVEKEGFLILGYWTNYLCGMRMFLTPFSYLRLGAGVNVDQTWSEKQKLAPILSVLWGIEKPVSEQIKLGIEIAGIGLLLNNKGSGSFLHLPKLTLSYAL